MTVPLSGDSSRKLISTPAYEDMPALSPDGRWITYVSGESGAREIYVQAYPGLGRKWQVSRGGGTGPRWSRAGDEIFYFSQLPEPRWFSVSVDTSDEFRASEPVEVFSGQFSQPALAEINYDYDARSKRFLAIRELETEKTELRL